MSHVVKKLERKAVSVDEAGEILGLSPVTIRRAIRAGRFRVKRLTEKGTLLIPMSEIDRFLETAGTENRA